MHRRLATIASLAASCTLVLAFLACGGSGDALPSTVEAGVDSGVPLPDTRLPPPHDTRPVDTGPEVDPGAPSDTYPAFPTNMPQIVNNGGYVMSAPTIVTVTWNGDPAQARFEGFGDAIGASDYWKQVASEYGIGPAVSGAANHVHMTDPFPSAGWTTDDVDTFLQKQLGDTTTSGWPAPQDDSIYVLYFPPGSRFTYNGQPACTQIGGYHTSVAVGAQNVAYAVIPYCTSFGGGSHFDSMTSAASHELGEAATDPQPNVFPGYVGYDTSHVGWELFQLLFTENGDSCELYQDSYIRSTETAFSYSVQRLWSNAQAKAGHDPCVPAPTDPYFTVVPLATESITVNMSPYGGSSKTRTRGYAIPVGTTRWIEVGFISDAPTDDWTIDAQEGTPIFGFSSDTGHLTLGVVGPNSGRNGNKATLSVTVDSIGKVKGEIVTVISTDGAGTTHYAPILISSL